MSIGTTVIPRNITLGRALWGTHALWAATLAEWQRNQNDDSAWGGIEFDKLAHAVHLIWNELYKDKVVSFPSVYESRDGIHGPGPALERSDPPRAPIFALEAIASVQDTLGASNPDVKLFALTRRKYAGRRQYRVKPGKDRAWMPLHLADAIDPAFRGQDARQAGMLARLLAPLTQEQIRAIGTHQSAEGTIRAIEYNVYVHFFERVRREIGDLERPGAARRMPDQSELPSLQSIVTEVHRKAVGNRQPYSDARRAIAAAMAGNEVAATALRLFEVPEAIWENGEVRGWARNSEALVALLAYLEELRARVVPPSVAAGDRDARRRAATAGGTGLESMPADKVWIAEVCLPALPKDGSEQYRWAELLDAVLGVLGRLPGRTEYWDRYERAVQRLR